MQSEKKKESQFASGFRSSFDQIMADHELILTQKVFTEIFGSLTGIGAIINENRQIVFANQDFLRYLDVDSISSVLGRRPGEIVSCINAENKTGGCGTSHACSFCGAVNAIVESQRSGQKSCREAFITTRVNGKIRAIDIKFTSIPVTISGVNFYVLLLQDISHEKRLAALEKIFFHDLLNSAGTLNGLITLLKNGVSPDKERNLIDLSEIESQEIIDEIKAHKQLLSAENGDLKVNIGVFSSLNIIGDSIDRIAYHKSGNDKQIIIDERAEDINFETDRVILERVLINLIKNALEATPGKGRIIIGVNGSVEKIRFWVKNDHPIPFDIQKQLFQRSFSTKGNGRGLGTYSIRLLTENYLKGSVSFVSNENEGTVFEVKLNIKFA